MSPSDFAALLMVAREHRVKAFELGDVKVTFSELAFIPEHKPNPTELVPAGTIQQSSGTEPTHFRGIPLSQLFPDG